MRRRVADSDLDVETMRESDLWRGREEGVASALRAAARAENAGGAVVLLLTDDAAVARLNQQWRGKSGPTNVLSFPAPQNPHGHLGDIAMAAEIIAAEARAQGKSLDAHAAHLAVHGFLHLLGYDHHTESEAEIMEARERAILASLGLADPYAAETMSEPPR
jgi:probable rRNA maturation factor